MLKTIPPDANWFNHLKCGEIYYETPTSYNVNCCLCGKKQSFDEFPQHFQTEHLNQEDLDKWILPTNVHLAEAKPLVTPPLLDQTEIKCESDEEKPLSLLFPMDEKPVDLRELRSDGRKTNNIVVESLKIKSRSSVHDLNKSSNAEKSTTAEMDVNENYDGLEAADNFSVFDDNEATESTDEESSAADLTKETYFPCTQCSSSYKTKRGLNNHVRNKHKNVNKPKGKSEKFKCKECDLEFPNEKFLRGHMFKHTGIICDICGKPFSQVGNMNLHKIRHTGIKAHKCTDCERCFYTDMELKKHRVSHTGKLPVICEVCGRGCRDQSILNAHMRRHTGERPAKCEVCGKCFYSIYDLNVHSVTHSTLRPFKCDECGSTFQTKKALRVHKKLHSKDRKHVCKICGKAFAQSGGLYSHMKTHDTAEGVVLI